MDRRDFVRATVAGAAAVTATSGSASAEPAGRARAGEMGGVHAAPTPAAFRLAYAPHFGMFRQHGGEDLVAQLEFMAAEGFTALEDNDMRTRPVAEQERIAAAMQRLKIRMGVFVAHAIAWNDANLTGGDQAKREAFLADIRNSVEVAKRVNARWMTVVPGLTDRRLDLNYQTAHLVESLKQASAILEPHGLVMVLEPLNNRRDHPGLFLQEIPQAYLICKAVDSPACKILDDLYHQQITEGNLIPNINLAWDEIAYFQVGDNPGRKEPGSGEINYRNVFKHIHDKGFTGIVGMEHGNSRPGRDGERAVIDAYVAADGW
ncbi:MAG: TIM barrel protein [Gemmatimonadota bacterium]|nr:TIM barrel protein [Gemmatimonadota bacterium]